jgi:hypothetical protein
MEDDDDIINRRSDFTGQVNNMLCYFKALDPFVRSKLFTSYCTSLYGCELWSLTNRRIEDLCVAWRKSLRAVWRLPQSTHKYLLLSISHCLPVFDEICRRSLNFIKSCINHHSQLIRFISLHSVFYSRGSSIAGQNGLFCTHRFRCFVQDILHGSVDYLTNSYLRFNTDGEMRSHANVLLELLLMRDGNAGIVRITPFCTN